MDSDDERDLWNEWKRFDKRLQDFANREAHKFSKRLDKLVKERLGWRKYDPENENERFERFLDYVDEVYLRPSLNLDVPTRSWSVDGLWSEPGQSGSH